MPRKPFSERLTPEQEEIIQAGDPEAKMESKPAKKKLTSKKARKQASKQPGSGGLQAEESLQPVTVRLPRSLIYRLQRVSLERKQAGAVPATMQEIISAAVGEWLDREE